MTRIQRLSALGLLTFVTTAWPALGERFSQWSEPVNLGSDVNSPQGDFFPTVSRDGLTLYFTSSRPHGPEQTTDWDIYVSRRAHVRDPWGPAENLGATINTPFNEGAPSLSRDGRHMFFASDRPGGFGGNDIYVSRRHNKRDDFSWQLPENIGTGVNTSENEASPALFEDVARYLVTLYFDSNRPAGTGFGPFTDDPAHNGNDIYASMLQPDDTFGPATLIAELSTEFIDRQPVVRRDGLELFLASNRTGTLGFLDLWVSTRASTSDEWSTPLNVGTPVNTTANEAGPALSFDARTLYFQSVGAVAPAFDLYATMRKRPKRPGAEQYRH
jgi:hypothetical protein